MTHDTILTAPSDSELAAAVQGNLFALFRAMAANLSDAEIVETTALSHHHTFPANPMFNGVWGARLSSDEADDAIDQTMAWFREREVPYVFWWTDSNTEPADLPERLQAHGFAANITGDPGMATDLHALNEETRTPEGFTIVRVSDLATMADWRDAFCGSYDLPTFAGQSWVDATEHMGFASAPWQCYVGYLDGRPVATNILFNGGGVASVYGVGTVPEVRGKGIGAAITLQPLLDAREQGYRYGVLFSSDMGVPVYHRLGFREVGCTTGRYMWVNQ